MCSKELYKLPVIQGVVYGITKYQCVKCILLHYENNEMKE